VRCDKYRFGKPHASRPPNRRLQLTPLRGPEIAAILKADFGLIATSIYRCGATEAQDGRPRGNAVAEWGKCGGGAVLGM